MCHQPCVQLLVTCACMALDRASSFWCQSRTDLLCYAALLLFKEKQNKARCCFPLCSQVSLYFSESPTNPYLRCIDVEKVAALCHAHGALVCIDGTFATPINQQAIPRGADLILHSATKYLAGHNDVRSNSYPLIGVHKDKQSTHK